jgi:phage terminase large subunit GpA-like protein
MDAFVDPTVRIIIGMFSAQTSKTTIIENAAGYFAQHDPCPIMWVEPTLDIAEAMSKDRVSPMIRDTPALRAVFSPQAAKSRGDTLLHKIFPGGSLTLAGANSYNSLASRPIRIAIGDEAAKWQANEKGSPIRQLSARVKGFWNSKVALFSTPTTADENNEFFQLWERSDQRLFRIPCDCGVRLVFVFDGNGNSLPCGATVPRAILEWEEAAPVVTGDGRKIRQASAAWFRCLSCNRRIDDTDRRRMVQGGEWEPTAPFTGIAGFWGWQALSPFESAAAVHIANEWLSALGSDATLQSAKNETLGLPWQGTGDAPDWERLYERQDEYETGDGFIVPARALYLTAGVDVQGDRIEVQILAHAKNGEHWLVDYVVISGSPFADEIWAKLTECLERGWAGESGAHFWVKLTAIDSGHATHEVYKWARGRADVMVVKGFDIGELLRAPSWVDINWRGQKIKRGIQLWAINVSELKRRFYNATLRLSKPDAGEPAANYFHFSGRDREWCKQLTAEHEVTKKVKGYPKKSFEQNHNRNEALDTHGYGMAAAIRLTGRYRPDQWAQAEAAIAAMAVEIRAEESIPLAPIFRPIQQSRPRPQIRLGGF